MGGDEDRRAVGKIGQNSIEYEVTGGGVDAAERLVEDVEAGFSRHDENELELFLHALGHLF